MLNTMETYSSVAMVTVWPLVQTEINSVKINKIDIKYLNERGK